MGGRQEAKPKKRVGGGPGWSVMGDAQNKEWQQQQQRQQQQKNKIKKYKDEEVDTLAGANNN